MGQGSARFLAIALLLAGGLAAAEALNAAGREEARARPLNAAPEVKYVGSKACAGCHQRLYDGFVQTAMGRSMGPAGAASQLALAPKPVTVYSARHDRFFEVFQQDGKLFQREYAKDGAGELIFDSVHELAYVAGSGVNGYSYVVRRGDHLFQAPLSYYTREEEWDLSPGYEFADYGFNRVIHEGCLACHAGRPEPVPGVKGKYKDPPFSELAIGCENCHGPGELHAERRLAGAGPEGERDPTIVHPSRLDPRLAEDICMNCHQRGDTRVLQPGKSHFDFRPGMPLSETVAILKIPSRLRPAQDADLLEHHTAMKLSRCFRASGGELSCLSCHEIHNQPAPAAKTAYYREKCLACHANTSCALPLEERNRGTPANDCASCHMPKRGVDVIAHSSLTNHRIVARRGQPPPPEAYRRTTPGLEDLIHVNLPPGQEESNLPPRLLFHAYGELMSQVPEYQPLYLDYLDRAAETHPDDPLVLTALARRERAAGGEESRRRAMAYLQKAVRAGSAIANPYKDLAALLSEAGRHAEAAEVLKQGLEKDPFNQDLHKSLTLAYINLKRYGLAEASMRDYVKMFPEDSFMRGLLEKVENFQ